MSDFVPQYKRIYEDLKKQILEGKYQPNQKLPFEKDLCNTYNAQRITVRRALDFLVKDQLIVKRPGLGSFVCDKSAEASPIASFGTLLFIMNKSQNDIQSNVSAYNAQLFFLMEHLCRSNGYTLLYTGVTGEDDIQRLMEQYHVVAAFLVSSLPISIVDFLVNRQVPSLCLNHFDERLVSVLPDNQKGIYTVVKYLKSAGHERIGFISGPRHACNAIERLEGFYTALGEVQLNESVIVEADWTYEGAQQAVATSLKQSEKMPSAWVAASDMMALGAIEALHRQGLRVPEDVSVVGFDNIDMCRFSSPPLTSIGPDTRQMAVIATDHIFEMLRRGMKPSDRYTIRIPVDFFERQSVGLCRK